MIHKHMIKHRGFEHFAWHVLINEIENGNMRDGYSYESDNIQIFIKQMGKEFNFAIRCYCDKWYNTEITFKP